MSTVTAAMVKDLRESTGAGMMDCKKALAECNGDMDLAVDYLRKTGLLKAGKKAGRIAAEGAVLALTSEKGNAGVIFELNCETDFVAKTDEFRELNLSICDVILKNTVLEMENLLSSRLGEQTIQTVIDEKVAKIGEKITPRRFAAYFSEGFVKTYVHMGGKIGVIVELLPADLSVIAKPQFQELAADLTMHIAAAAPQYLCREEVPSTAVTKEIEIYKEQLRNEGKKEEMLEKIATGKVAKFYQEVCLLEQPFVKEVKMSISQVVESVAKQLGTTLHVRRFTRFVLGEGIEKKQEDFAEEVRKTAGN